MQGRVVWTFDVKRDSAHLMTGSGIKFVDLGTEQRRVLEDYLARVSARNVPPAAPYTAAH